MNYSYLKARQIKPVKVKLNLASILDEQQKTLTEDEINKRMLSLRECILQSQEDLTALLDNLNYCSKNLDLIIGKWGRAQQFRQILFAVSWSNLIYKDQDQGPTLISCLLELVGDMIAFSPNCIETMLQNIVIKLFSGDTSKLADDTLDNYELLIFKTLHVFMRDLVITYPPATSMVSALIASKFPHHHSATNHNFTAYFINALNSLDYLVDVRPLLTGIVDKLVWLELSSCESSSSTDKVEPAKNMAVKCFTLFDIAFDLFLTKTRELIHPEGSCYEITQAEAITDILGDIYMTQIGNIEALVNLPFCLIYWSSFSDELCDRTLESLWFHVVKRGERSLPRAAFLLSSMMVEASYIKIDHVVGFLENAVNWSLSYIESYSNVVINEKFNPNVHAVFYAVTQSIFYIISCKIGDFDQVHLKSLRLLNLQSLIMSNLNPLLFCLPTIVDQFVEISRHHQIALCSMVVERNKRLEFDVAPFFAHSLCYYFPFNSFTFQIASPKFDSLLCY